MKKKIKNIVVGATLMTAMVIGIQTQKNKSVSSDSLFEVNKNALAYIEGWVGNYEWYIDFYAPGCWTCYKGGSLRCPV